MTEDYTTVYEIVFMEQFRNHFDALSEVFNLEANVLCNNSGAFSTLTSNDWQDALTDSPPRIVFLRVLRVKTRDGCRDIFQLVFNESQVFIYCFFRVAFSLEQDSACTFRHFTNEVRYIFKALNGAQGLIVHHFCSDNLFTAHISERYNCKGCIVQCFEEHEATAFMRHVFNRVVHYFRYEAQCTFGTDKQVVDDVDNIFKINEGVQAVACCIFNFIFVVN